MDLAVPEELPDRNLMEYDVVVVADAKTLSPAVLGQDVGDRRDAGVLLCGLLGTNEDTGHSAGFRSEERNNTCGDDYSDRTVAYCNRSGDRQFP